MARLLSVNVGRPREVAWRGQTVRTAIWKEPAEGRRWVGRLNVDGDGQADLVGHGGEHRAVYVYQIESYRYWQDQLSRDDFTFGQFGENFTVDGLSDDEVCVGDRYRIGDALVEVTQPRGTCFKVGIRMDEPRMPSLLVSHGRRGFYLRILEEGEVGAGDEIVEVSRDPEGMTVAQVSALLYLPPHSRQELEQVLRVAALSDGWRDSFRAMLEVESSEGARGGNPGLVGRSSPLPAWAGFRPLRVAAVSPESSSVVSFELEPADALPVAAALPRQFLTLRLLPEPQAHPLLRSYSLSGAPGAERYRISVKQEPHGAGSTYLHTAVHVGDLLDVGAPRGTFTLQPGDGPVVLASAGVGATPVLAMLKALAAEPSNREVWWLYGCQNRAEHPFAEESRALVHLLPHGRSHIRYSRPGPGDRPGLDFDAPGHLEISTLIGLGVPRDADFYLCGPTSFLGDFTAGLVGWGVSADRVHSEVFGPQVSSVPAQPPHPPAGPPGTGPVVSFSRSGLTVRWGSPFRSLLELAEACDVPADWSCRTGVCHRCESALVDGDVAYEPDPLDAPAPGNVLLC